MKCYSGNMYPFGIFPVRAKRAKAKELGCQFIIASHSPFFIGIEGATVYDMDADVIQPCDWKELESIQVYKEFFRRLE